MRILITTGLMKENVGGPAQYGPRLKEMFENYGHQVGLIAYGREKHLPIGIRHLAFLIKIVPSVIWADWILTLDTFSVGVPSIAAAKIFGKKSIIRVGGDFLWEFYIERTGQEVTLKQFNEKRPPLNFKEKLILFFTRNIIKSAKVLVFNTDWQKGIWGRAYNIPDEKTRVVRNFIPTKRAEKRGYGKTYLWAGRRIKLKNIKMLEELAQEFHEKNTDLKIELVSGLPRHELEKEIENAYAVILPSFSEVSPNFVLEAASFGKPFIVTKETGLREIYNKGGIFVDPFDKKDIKKAILEMAKPERYAFYQKELASVEVERSWGEVAGEFIDICSNL